MNDYASIVWILRGLIGSTPGVMVLRNGQLSLATEGALVFEAPLANVREVRFPWYYFWGAMKMKVNDAPYRISFVQPNNVPPVDEPALLNSASIVPLAG